MNTDNISEHPPSMADRTVISTDDLFEVLRNRRRRYALHYLAGRVRDEHVAVDDLVDWVAAREVDEADASEIRRRVATALVHFHLPKLADVGFIEYDTRRRCVRYRGTDRLERWLDGCRSEP